MAGLFAEDIEELMRLQCELGNVSREAQLAPADSELGKRMLRLRLEVDCALVAFGYFLESLDEAEGSRRAHLMVRWREERHRIVRGARSPRNRRS